MPCREQQQAQHLPTEHPLCTLRSRALTKTAEPLALNQQQKLGPDSLGPTTWGLPPSVLPSQALGLLPLHVPPGPSSSPRWTSPHGQVPVAAGLRPVVRLGNLTPLIISAFIYKTELLVLMQDSRWRTLNLAAQYRRPHVARSKLLPLSSGDPGHADPHFTSCTFLQLEGHISLHTSPSTFCLDAQKKKENL